MQEKLQPLDIWAGPLSDVRTRLLEGAEVRGAGGTGRGGRGRGTGKGTGDGGTGRGQGTGARGQGRGDGGTGRGQGAGGREERGWIIAYSFVSCRLVIVNGCPTPTVGHTHIHLCKAGAGHSGGISPIHEELLGVGELALVDDWPLTTRVRTFYHSE